MRIRIGYIFIVLLSISPQLVADPGATDDLISVKSESMQVNRQTGVHTLSGNVVITHHDIRISADTIQVTRENSAISRVSGTGSPLLFEQRLADSNLIIIKSREIDYQTRTWTVVLRGEVLMQKGRSKISASVVEYNLRDKSYTAKSAGGENSRVEFTYSGLNQAVTEH